MKTLLITGSTGQLGGELARLLPEFTHRYRVVWADRSDIDLSIADADAWTAFLDKHRPDAVVNCAAYTKVDKAEQEPDLAFAANTQAPLYMAQWCHANDALMLHFSTDFVFDGKKNTPYRETDPVAPIGVYGLSKLKGEENVLAHNRRSIVVRTSWVYSTLGNNFVKTMRRLGSEKYQLRVVADQTGSPTYAADLAQASLKILYQTIDIQQHQAFGQLFHYANLGVCSWFDLAHQTIQLSGIDCSVSPIETKDYPTPAQRPAYSVLSSSLIRQTFDLHIPYWRDSLKRCIEQFE